MLLGHSLGILQAPLSGCSSQALQLVSIWRRGDQKEEEEKGLYPNIGALEERGFPIAYCLTLLLSPDKVPEPTPQRTLPLPRPLAGPGRHFP